MRGGADADDLPRRRAVVVTDEPAVLALYRDMLEELDLEPVTLVTHAVETERIRDARPDVVILDLEVRDQASYGVEMARQLREDPMYATIPIVVATAKADALHGERENLRKLGVPVLLKPFTLEEIGSLIGVPVGEPQ